MNQRQKIALAGVLLLIVAAAGGGAYHLWQGKKPAPVQKAAQGQTLYTCAMHPFIVKDKPGTCPVCGMTLIKKIEAPQGNAQVQQLVGQVALSPSQQVMANVAVAPAQSMPLTKEVVAT